VEPSRAPDAPSAPRAWRSVAAFRDPDEARLLAGRLEAEGLDARIHPEPPTTVYGRDTAAMFGQPTEVLVPEEQVRYAEQILEDIRGSG
jgi:hypothetical protein